MNNYFVYAIWAIIPLLLLLLSTNALINKVFRVKPKEDGVDYFKQFLFVLVPYGLAIAFDQYVFHSIINHYQIEPGGQFLGALLVFPILLWICTDIERRIRRRFYPQKGSKLTGTYDYTA